MSALRDAMSHAALGWVKPELDETLRLVRNEVEYFVEDPADSGRMRFCAGYLHQVQGTLRMVELYAPALVAEELEQLALAIGAGGVADRDEACATLMRGSVLLPDYLERLQNGHRDIPIVLLPLLNDIRAARGAALVNESVLLVFAPESVGASEAEVDHARGSLSGRNRELLDTVGGAVKEELLQIKDALDLHLRTGGEPSQLQQQVDDLGAVADTLAMMGLDVARGVVVQQRDALREVVAGGRHVDEGMLLDIAGALLYVDASLDDQVAHLGAAGSGEDDPAAAETRRTVEVLAHEAIANFTAAREHVVAFIETGWNHAELEQIPRLLAEVSGALRMLDLGVAADYLQGVQQYVAVELMARQRVPSGRQLDTLADAMASLEYYLEALRDRRPGREEILDITRTSLEALRYWPLPDASSDTPDPLAVSDAGALEEPVSPVQRETILPPPLPDAAIEMPRPGALAAPTLAASFADSLAYDALPPAPAAQTPDTDAGVDGAPLLFAASRAAPPDLPQWELASTRIEAREPSASDEESRSPTFADFDPVRDPASGAYANWSLGPGRGGDVADDDGASDQGSVAARPDSVEEQVAADVGPDSAGELVIDASGFDPVLAEQDPFGHDVEAVTFHFDDGALSNADSVLALDTHEASGPMFGHDIVVESPVMPPEPLAGSEPSASSAIELDEAQRRFLADLDAAVADFEPAPEAPGPMPRPTHAATDDVAADAGEPAPWAYMPEEPAPQEPAHQAPIHQEAVQQESTLPETSRGSAAPMAVSAGFDAAAENIDEDIREVFLEEFEDELTNLQALVPLWRQQPDNLDRLRPIRRIFHTLKGSGRLVGARTLGEFAWKIEGMLNRVLDGSRSASPAVVAMIDRALETLPELQAALRDGSLVTADLQGLQAVADRVGSGEETFHVPLPPSVDQITAVEGDTTGAVMAEAQEDAAGDASFGSDGADAAAALPLVPEQDAGHEQDQQTGAAAAAAPGIDEAGTGTPAIIDSVLREILEAEVHAHMATFHAWLQQVPSAAVTDALLRAVHTMNGAFAMTDVPEITAATGAAESYLKRALAAGEPPSAEAVAALADTAVAIETTMQALQAESPRVAAQDALASRLHALAATLPDARWPTLAMDLEDSDEVGAGADRADAGDVSEDTDVGADAVEAAGAAELADSADRADGGDVSEGADVGTDASGASDDALIEGDAVSPQGDPASDVDLDLATDLTAWFDTTGLPPGQVSDASVHEDGAGLAQPAGMTTEAAATDEMMAPRHEDAPATSAALTVADDLSVYLDEAVEASLPDATSTDLPQPQAEEADGVPRTDSEDAADEDEADEDEARDSLDDVDASAAFGDAVSWAQAEEEGLHLIDGLEEDARDGESDTGAAHDYAADAEDAGIQAADLEGVDDLAALDGVQPATGLAASADDDDGETDTLGAGGAERAPLFEMEPVPGTGTPTPDAEPARDLVDAAVAAAAAEPSDRLDFSVLDQELVDIFVEEGKDLLDHCDGLISELRQAPDDREALTGLQRDLHTLKGGARMAGINAVGDLGHAIESLLENVAAGRTVLARGDVRLLERGFDRLHQLLIRTGQHLRIDPATALVAEFEARTANGGGDVRDDAGSVLPDEAVATPLSAPLPAEVPAEDDGQGRPQQEQVRVRADLLDRLVNHAGEVAIYRSRLEQQLGAFRGAMGELERTNARLRDQLRRLDLETEAQIVARYQREQDQADHAFDPLELDRFSTLQQLSRALNESAADLGGLQGVLDDLSRQYDGLLQQQSRVSSELQDGLMRARMVPFDGVVPRLRRVVRQSGVETGKQVHLTLVGTHGELDRNVLDRMVAPLEHMLRNSVAHGLESPEQRREVGKPEEGTIALRLHREGSEIVLEVADDGAGLDREAIRRRATERGLVADDAVLADSELDNLIFASGFTTADQVSQLAGRGVGMDVVRNEVRQLGGTVDIHSVRGEGVRFTLRLPQTLAVTQAVFVQIGETTFAVPVASVSGIGRIARERIEAGDTTYRYSGEEYTLHDLGSLVGQATARAEGQAQVPLLLVRAGDLRAAVAIDQVLGNREIVVKPVGLQIASVPGIYGATITGDGRVVVILDVAPLVRRHLASPQRPVVASAQAQQRQVPLVMVVDDSLTMRKVTGRILERHNFEVSVARDGVEALERLEERVPDLMLLDIEMPRMDGYELATAMRADPRYRDVPIVMITSRSGEKHRQRAFEIGVQRYLGKPYQELDLMRNVYDLLGIARVRE